MKKKIKISLILSLAIIFGCFSNVFAATNQNNKMKKIAEVKKSVRFLDNVTDDGGVVGTRNLNGTADNSANIGDQLTSPEIGWKRYDDTNSKITYTKDWINHSYLGCYNNTETYSNTSGITKNISFSFYGTKFRIIGNKYPTYSSAISVIVDGSKVDTYNASSSLIRQALLYKYDSNKPMAGHSVVLQFDQSISDAEIDAIDIDSTGYLDKEAISLNKTTDSLTLGQTDILVATVTPDNVTNKTVNWTSSDPTTVSVDENGNIKALKAGTATITATTTDGSNLSKSCVVTVNDPLILNIEPEKTKINLNDTVSANLMIDNIRDIAAEDIRIKYDSTKLQFLNYAEVDGIKLVENDVKDGELRFILASKGKANIIDTKKILLKLNFKGIAAGDALVDVTNGRVSDGITKEWDLTDEQCGQATITIQKLSDVNNSGEYTLLDLGIDARHEGEDPSTLPQYNTDQDGNKAIDDTDLTQIGKNILENPDYAPNNIK